MTGAEFKALFELAWDKPYSVYYDDTELNRIAEYSLFNIVERDYRNLLTQKQYDEVTNLIKTQIPVTLRDNLFHTSYLPITNVTVVGTTVTITTGRPHYIDAGDSVTVSSVSGGTVTNINGTFTVVTAPTSTTFTYTSGGSAIATYSAGSGKVQTGFMLTDYFHYFAIKGTAPATYTANVTGMNNTGLTATVPYIEVTCPAHNLRTGDTFTLSGSTGIANINGTWTPAQYTIRNKNVIWIYGNSYTGTYSSGGVVTVVLSEWVVPYRSDAKISKLNIPDVQNPRIEVQSGTLRFYPSTLTSVEIDYMTVPPYSIDVTRTADDILLYYPRKFVDLLISEMVIQASASSRDFDFFQVENTNQSANP